MWAQIQGCMSGLTRKGELAEKAVAKVGDPPFTMMVDNGVINPGSTPLAGVFWLWKLLLPLVIQKWRKKILARFPRGDPELLNPREEDPLEAKQAFAKEKP